MRSSDLTSVRWIFFDLGNTLINEKRARRKLLAQISQRILQHNENATPENLERRIAQGFALFEPDPWLYALSGLLANCDMAQKILQDLPYPKYLEEPYPEALPIISALARAGFRLGIIANQSRGTEERLRTYGLRHHFSLCFSSAELGVAKPDPAIFHIAADRSGCLPSELMMVGDRIDNDIRPARRCGWKTIRVCQGLARRQKPRDFFDQAEWSCRTLPEVAQILGIAAPATRDSENTDAKHTREPMCKVHEQ